jgi:2-succinyl-5-enolpyruvyl-6-hydroxy-3-cyclohexene-1-carboxylate synthase
VTLNPSTAQARVLVDELVRAGVREAVLCPGSRNAPLSFALHAADAAGRLRMHVRIDERTAAFLALGLALRSGRPVPVVCTSGTAAANLHPAVLEASYAGVPLLAVTADRPPELIGVGANQAVVQPGMYADAPRASVAVAVAGRGGAGDGEAGWRAAVARAVRLASGTGGGPPGPVHVNVPFADPLVPEPAASAGDAGSPPRSDVPPCSEHPEASLPDAGPEHRAEGDVLPLDPDLPTLVVGGAVPVGTPPLDLPDDVPVIAEPSSPLWARARRSGPWLLGAPDAVPVPVQVLLHGRPTLHRSVGRLLADQRVAVYGVGGTTVAGWPRSVRAVGVPPRLNPPAGWGAAWAHADAVAAAALDKALGDPSAPAGLRLAAALVAAVPDGALLTLGSSNPVRDVSLAAAPRPGLTLLANRGVAGIDGTVSTALGAALAHPEGAPAFALLGDLTALHDLTGLVIGPDEPRPDLTFVVLNDAGGGIFSLLEQGAPEHAGPFERVFGTPHRVRLDALCAGFGLEHRRVEDLAALAAALGGAGDGIRVVEVPARREGLREGHEALRAAVRAALS